MNMPTFNLRYPTNLLEGRPEIAYPFEWFKNTIMITDVACQKADLAGAPNPEMEAVIRYELTREELYQRCPGIPTGSYISGSNTEPYQNNSTYPQRALRQELFTEDELWPENTYNIPPPVRILKYSNRNASTKFAKYLTLEVKRRGLNLVFLDNFAVTQGTGSLEKLEDVTDHTNSVAACLHAEGIKCIGNIAGEPSLGVSDKEWETYCSSLVDGWSWEMAGCKEMRNDPNLILTSLRRFQWLAARKTIILIPTEGSYGKPFTSPPDIDTYGNFARFLAGISMLIRWQDNKIFVAWPMWREPLDWETWPNDFGPAIGSYYQDQSNLLLFHRKFTNGILTVMFGDEPQAKFERYL